MFGCQSIFTLLKIEAEVIKQFQPPPSENVYFILTALCLFTEIIVGGLRRMS